MMTALTGTGRLADDLWLMAHHEASGKPYLQPRALGICLAAGLLAELVLAGSISLAPPAAVVVTTGMRPDDALARDVLRCVRSEPEPRPVRDWLLFLARSAAGDVAVRLEHARYLVRAGRRIPGGTGRWRPADASSALTATIRACSVLDATRPPTIYDGLLAGLAAACGLTFRLADHAPSRAPRRLENVVARLHPVFTELIRQTQVTVDSAVLSHRA
jgi:hypothetical protein